MFCIFIRNNFLNFQIYFNIWDRQMVFNILNMNLLIKNSNLIITNLNHTSLAWLRMIMDPLPVFNSIVFAFNSIILFKEKNSGLRAIKHGSWGVLCWTALNYKFHYSQRWFEIQVIYVNIYTEGMNREEIRKWFAR